VCAYYVSDKRRNSSQNQIVNLVWQCVEFQ